MNNTNQGDTEESLTDILRTDLEEEKRLRKAADKRVSELQLELHGAQLRLQMGAEASARLVDHLEQMHQQLEAIRNQVSIAIGATATLPQEHKEG